jgi:hypothetical protein
MEGGRKRSFPGLPRQPARREAGGGERPERRGIGSGRRCGGGKGSLSLPLRPPSLVGSPHRWGDGDVRLPRKFFCLGWAVVSAYLRIQPMTPTVFAAGGPTVQHILSRNFLYFS